MVKFKSKLPSMIIACLMALVIMISAVTPAFAAGTASVGSVAGDVDGGTIIGQDVDQGKQTVYDEFDVTGNMTSNADVYVTVPESDIMVTVPKVVILDGKSGASNVGEYTVKVQGDIAAETVIKVVPQDEMDDRDGVNFEMSSVGKDNIPTDVEQAKTEFTYADGVRANAAASTTGTVTAYGMTAGQWNGDFVFNISAGAVGKVNLFNAANAEAGYWNSKGQLENISGVMNPGYIPVEYGATYQISANYSPAIVLFNENQEFVKAINTPNNNLNYYLTIDDERVAYMSFNISLTDVEYAYVYKVSEADVETYSKTIGVLGDSISFGLRTHIDPVVSGTIFSYPRLLAKEMEANLKLYAQSGTCIAGSDTKSITNRASSMVSGLDMYVVMGGVNDFITDIPLGTSSDATTDTFYGALNVLLPILVEKAGDSPIVFLTPLELNLSVSGETTNEGATLNDYVTAIKEVCALYDNVTIIDTHAWSQDNLDVNDSKLYADYVHPTQEGHALIADYVYSQLKALGLV